MYDDLLGKRKSKEDNIGVCSQCVYISKTTPNESFILCGRIKKYVHANQQGCLKFRKKVLEGSIFS